jgi:hypothetical protein
VLKKSRIPFLSQIIPKRQRLVGGGFERETFPFTDFQKSESLGGYVVDKKSVGIHSYEFQPTPRFAVSI